MAATKAPRRIRCLDGFDDFVEQCLADWGVPGCAVGIVKGGRMVYVRGFGLRDTARELPVTERTSFPIKSGTKAFTATAAAVLVGEGRLDWDTPVRRYVPSFRMHDPAATRRTTIRDLLVHRTGLASHYAALYSSLATRAGVLDRLPYLEPRQDFRSGFHYANLGYATAGAILEHVADIPWQRLVSTRIFSPLGMSRSGFGTGESAGLAELAVGYRKGSRRPVPWFQGKCFDLAMACEPKVAAMGIVSNVLDMCRWLRFQMNLGRIGQRTVIPSRALEETHAPQVAMGGTVRNPHLSNASYAMGWHVQSYRDHRWLHHSGSGHGYSASISFVPEQSVGVVMLTNGWRTPLRWIIPFSVYDRLLGLDALPWNETYLRIAKRERKRRKAEATQEPKDTSPSSRSLRDYEGEYCHPGYGRLSVRITRGRLRIHYNGITFRGRGRGKHVFDVLGQYEDPAVADPMALRAKFRMDRSGAAASLAMPLEASVSDIVFERLRDSDSCRGRRREPSPPRK